MALTIAPYDTAGSTITVQAADLGGVAEGDVLLVYLANRWGSTSTYSAPSGWTSKFSNAWNSTADILYATTLGASPGSSWAFGCNAAACAAIKVPGGDLSSLKIGANDRNSAGAAPTAPAVTPAGSSDYNVALVGWKLAPTVTSYPAAYTDQQGSRQGGTNQGVAWATRKLTSGASTGTAVWALSTASDYDALQFTITGTDAPADPGPGFYLYDGTTWGKTTPQVYDGSAWNACDVLTS